MWCHCQLFLSSNATSFTTRPILRTKIILNNRNICEMLDLDIAFLCFVVYCLPPFGFMKYLIVLISFWQVNNTNVTCFCSILRWHQNVRRRWLTWWGMSSWSLEKFREPDSKDFLGRVLKSLVKLLKWFQGSGWESEVQICPEGLEWVPIPGLKCIFPWKSSRGYGLTFLSEKQIHGNFSL